MALLLSMRAVRRMGIVLDLKNEEIEAMGVRAPLSITKQGQIIFELHQSPRKDSGKKDTGGGVCERRHQNIVTNIENHDKKTRRNAAKKNLKGLDADHMG